MTRPKVLLVEDQEVLGGIIKESLESRGFDVIYVTDGAFVYETYLDEKPDILVLDIMLPTENGLTIARKIRVENNQMPILFLTARTLVEDVVNGFKAGGNDYLKKPFDLEELIIRIDVLLNKNRLFKDKRGPSTTNLVEIGEYQYDALRHTLLHRGVFSQLTARESDVLSILFQYRSQLLARKTLLLQVWGNDDFFSSRSLDVYISKLRRRLESDPTVRIINHRGFGYKLIC